MWALSKSNSAGSVRWGDLYFVSGILEEIMDFSIATKFTSTIKLNSIMCQVLLVVGDERGKEIDRRFLVVTNGNANTGTFAISDIISHPPFASATI